MLSFAGAGSFPDWEQEAGEGEDDGQPDVALPEEVDATVVEREEDVAYGEVGGGVVAQVGGIAEGESGDVVVVREPGDERQHGEAERGEPAQVKTAERGVAAVAKEEAELQRGEGGGLDDGGLFRERGEGEEQGDGKVWRFAGVLMSFEF